MSDDTELDTAFEIGDNVDVMSGVNLGDYGIVVRPPIDMRPEYVLVRLVRAHVMRYLPVTRLVPRA